MDRPKEEIDEEPKGNIEVGANRRTGGYSNYGGGYSGVGPYHGHQGHSGGRYGRHHTNDCCAIF